MRFKRTITFGLVSTLFLGGYVSSFFLARKPIGLRIPEKPPPNMASISSATLVVYYFSKSDGLNRCMWYFYWPMERACSADPRSLADRLTERMESKGNAGRRPTYVRDVETLKDIQAAGFD